MKILATSDMHGNLDGISLDGIDIAFFAGDIAPLHGHGPWHVYDQIKWMNRTFKNWCSRWPNTQIVFVPGNHDFFPTAKEKFGTKLAGHNLSIDLASNATMLIDQYAKINGLKVYGTPWVPIISYSWAFEADSSLLSSKFAKIPCDVDILVTHTPPRHKLLDVSLEYGEDSNTFGSIELRDAIIEKKPKMCFCGHIHSGDHSMNVIGETKTCNVSRVNEHYDVKYKPVIIDI